MPMPAPYKEEAASGLWRSQDMKLVSVTFERDKIKKDMLKIGRLGAVQFCDMNSSAQTFSKQFAGEVRRCEDVLRMLRIFRDQQTKWEPDNGWRVRSESTDGAYNERALDEAETEVRSVIADYNKTAENYQQLSANWLNAYEYWQLLDAAHVREVTSGTEESGLGLLAGTIPSAKVGTFERLAYRCTRGYCKLHLTKLPQPWAVDATVGTAGEQFKPDELDRHVFIGVFGSQSVGSRLKRLAQSMDARILLENNLSVEQRETEASNQRQAVHDISKMLMKSRESLQSLLRTTIIPKMKLWTRTAVIHKGIAHSMNLLHLRTHSAVGVAWVPASKMDILHETLGAGSSRGDSVVIVLDTPGHVSPPTYFETNQYTECFQGIVNSYGVPRYKEVNPGVFTIVTFPWLFGVMYGDIGHGLIITLVAALLIAYEKRLQKQTLNELVEMVFSARYLLLLMGLFATFYGALYNDCFGLMLEYTTPTFDMVSWKVANTTTRIDRPAICEGTACGICGLDTAPVLDSTTGYSAPSFGIDPAWSGASKKLDLYNSFKMKSAIVIGVCQMMLGLVLQFFNNRYYNDWKHIYFGFIPEVIFLTCTFGYMSFLIVLKWISPFSTGCKVSLLETMVQFFLSPGDNGLPSLFEGQFVMQEVLLGFAAISVMPFMLFPIPYIEWKYHSTHDYCDNDSDRESQSLMPQDTEMRLIGRTDATDHDLLQNLFPVPEYVFDMQEVCIKQIIHAIEFVLGSVSNTASYLRLWALSLAHAQLSEVFLEFLILMPLEASAGSLNIAVFGGFTVWLTATLGVLVGMEALSAFLHALRLHWVEFQNKFYIADGTMFTPLNMVVLEEEADEINSAEV